MLRKIFKIGKSSAITLSKKVLDDLGLKVGDRISLESDVEHRRIVVKPAGYKEQLSLSFKIRPQMRR